MGKRLPSVMGDNRQSLTGRLETIRHLEQISSQGRPIHLIADVLIKAGYTSLDEQARALGVSRYTAWTIVKTKHKLGRLNAKTTRCILANPDTPVSVRAIIHSILDRKN
jgi:hypothetical protein